MCLPTLQYLSCQRCQFVPDSPKQSGLLSQWSCLEFTDCLEHTNSVWLGKKELVNSLLPMQYYFVVQYINYRHVKGLEKLKIKSKIQNKMVMRIQHTQQRRPTSS